MSYSIVNYLNFNKSGYTVLLPVAYLNIFKIPTYKCIQHNIIIIINIELSKLQKAFLIKLNLK